MARLASGPAAAIQPSAVGVRGSRSRRATPPSAHRSIDVVRDAVAAGDEGVGELVAEDRGEEGDDPDHRGRPARRPRGSGATADEGADEDRAPVDTQRGAGEPAERDRSGEHRGDRPSRSYRSPQPASARCDGAEADRSAHVRTSTTVAQLRPLAPQIAGAGERRRAGEVQARHGRLVAGQLGLACCAARPAGRRRSWRRGRRGGGTRARRRRGSSPASRRSTRGSRARTASANSSSQRRGSGEPGQPPGHAVRRQQHLEAEHVASRRGAIVGSASDGTLTSSAGRSRTPPVAQQLARPRSISASVGAIVERRRQRARRVSRSRGSRSSDGVDLRLVAVGGRGAPPPRDHRRRARRGVGAATRRTCGAGRTPTRRSAP